MFTNRIFLKFLLVFWLIIIVVVIVLIFLLKSSEKDPQPIDEDNLDRGDDVIGFFGKSGDEYNVDDEAYFSIKSYVEAYIVKGHENDNIFFTPLEMKLVNEKENIKQYLVHGYIENKNFELVKDIYLVVKLDIFDEHCSINLIENKGQDFNEIKVDKFDENFENEDIQVNKWYYSNEKNISSEYINIFKNLSLCKPEEIYKHFNVEYANEKFGGLEGFLKYIEENKEAIKSMVCIKYSVNQKTLNDNNEIFEYVINDQYGNIYTFTPKSFLNYELKIEKGENKQDETKINQEENNQNEMIINQEENKTE